MEDELEKIRSKQNELTQKYNALVDDYSALKESVRVSLVKALAGLAADMAAIGFASPNFDRQKPA